MGTKIIQGDLLVTGKISTGKLDLSTKVSDLVIGELYEVDWHQRWTINAIRIYNYGEYYLEMHISGACAMLKLEQDLGMNTENTVEEVLSATNSQNSPAWTYNVNSDQVGYSSRKYEANTVQGSLSNLEESMTSVEGEISTTKEQISGLSTRVDTTESDIKSLNTNVTNLTNNKTNTSVLPNDNGDVKTKYRVAKKAANGSRTEWVYYKVCTLPVSNDANYASVIVSGRIGGWGTDSMGYINALLGNRTAPGISMINIATPLVSNLQTTYDRVDLVMYQNSDNTVTVYLKCSYYWVFDLDFEFFQSNIAIDYDGNYISTTPEGTLVAAASTSKQRVEVFNGDLLVDGKSLVKAATDVDNKVDKVEPHTIESTFKSRITASDTTGSKYEIPNGSVAYPVTLGGKSTASKNILNIPDQEEITKTLSGGHVVTYSVKDGVVTIKSIDNPNGTYHGLGIDVDLTPSLIRGETYYYRNLAETHNSGETELITSNIKITYTEESGKSTSYLGFSKLSSTTKRYFTFDNTVKSVNMYMQCANIAGSDTTTRVFKPMITLGDNVNEFEPYYNDVRPTKVVGIKSVGQNLLDFRNFYTASYTTVDPIDNGIRVNSSLAATEENKVYTHRSYFIPRSLIEPGKTYKISADVKASSTNVPRVYLTYRDKDFNNIGHVTALANTGSASFKASSTLDFEYILVIFYANSGGICKANDYVDYTNVYFGLADGEYQPYWEDTLNIPEVICNLPGYGLGINEEYCNYIDFNRKVYVQKVAEQVLTESDVANFSLSATLGTYSRFAVSGWTSTKAKQSKDIVLEGYPYNRNYAGDYCHAYIEGNCLFVFDTTASVSELKSKLIGKKLIYPIGTVIETDISEYLTETSYKVDNLGTELIISDSGKAVPTVIKYNVAINDQVIENSDNIAKIKTELATSYVTKNSIEFANAITLLGGEALEVNSGYYWNFANADDLQLFYTPTQNYHAVNKEYVDNAVANNSSSSDVLNAFTLSGSSQLGVASGYYWAFSGTGAAPHLYYTPTETYHAANKAYVDSAVSGVTNGCLRGRIEDGGVLVIEM